MFKGYYLLVSILVLENIGTTIQAMESFGLEALSSSQQTDIPQSPNPSSPQQLLTSSFLDRINAALSRLESRAHVPLISKMSYGQRQTFVTILYLTFLIGLSLEAQNDYVTIIGSLMRIFLPFAQTAYALHIQQYTHNVLPVLDHNCARLCSAIAGISIFLMLNLADNGFNNLLANNHQTPIVNSYNSTSTSHHTGSSTLTEVRFTMTFSEVWLTIYAGLQLADILYIWIADAYQREVA